MKEHTYRAITREADGTRVKYEVRDVPACAETVRRIILAELEAVPVALLIAIRGGKDSAKEVSA